MVVTEDRLRESCKACDKDPLLRHCGSCVVANQFKKLRFEKRKARQQPAYDKLYARVIHETTLTEEQLNDLIEASRHFYAMGSTREGDLSTLERIATVLKVSHI